MNRILVIRGGAIGDFILTLPAIGLLRRRFPQGHLEILGYKHIAALAENRFYADATRSIEYGQLARFFAKGAELPSALVDYFHGFDLIVSYLFDPDQIFETNLRRCGTFEFICGPSKPEEQAHASAQLAAPLDSLGLRLPEDAARLFPSAHDRELAREFLTGAGTFLLAFHPGSGSEAKNWPLKFWNALAAELLVRYPTAFLLVFGGEADRTQLLKLRQDLPAARVRVAEDLALTTLAAIAENCALYIGHDSGISHLAAAVGTPSVLLFGPTNPAVWAPTNPNVRVLRSADGSMSSLKVTDVTREIAAILETQPSAV